MKIGIAGNAWAEASEATRTLESLEDLQADMGLLRDELSAVLTLVRIQGKHIQEQDKTILLAAKLIALMSDEIALLKKR